MFCQLVWGQTLWACKRRTGLMGLSFSGNEQVSTDNISLSVMLFFRLRGHKLRFRVSKQQNRIAAMILFCFSAAR